MDQPNSKAKSRLQFSYLADELGHILETRPTAFNDPSFDVVLTPLRKPVRPRTVDTPEKKALWDNYWANVVGWWEGERMNERRSRW